MMFRSFVFSCCQHSTAVSLCAKQEIRQKAGFPTSLFLLFMHLSCFFAVNPAFKNIFWLNHQGLSLAGFIFRIISGFFCFAEQYTAAV
jgi:hypothetical protein